MIKKSLAIVSLVALTACATEGSRVMPTQTVESYDTQYQGVRSDISIGNFDNRSNYARGVFSDGVDRLGSQAKTILQTHLQQSGRFNVMDRDNMSVISQEAQINQRSQSLKGANYVITGDVTEFGRKTQGDRQLFGILGRGKNQIAYAKVNLNVVDVHTSQVVYASQGAGEYNLSSREIVGFGGTSGYDSTLNGKVLELAIREAVNNLVKGVESGAWRP